MADKWAQAGFTPIATPKANPIQRQRELAPVATQASINNANVNAEQGSQALSTARATAPADITKAVADAQKAVLEFKQLQQQQGFLELKDQQALAAARAVLMANGETIYRNAIKRGYEPTNPRNMLASAAQGVPWVGPGVADWVRDSASEAGHQGESIFQEGALRTVSGAGTRKEEKTDAAAEYFPTAWQSKSRENRRRLEALRAQQIATARSVAGPALIASGQAQPLGGAQPATPQIPTLAKFLIAAKKANPGVSDAALTAYYNKEYGGR